MATAAAKRALHARTGAAAVDLESAAVAEAAARHAVPVRRAARNLRFGRPLAPARRARRPRPAWADRRLAGRQSRAVASDELPALIALASDAARARVALSNRVDAIKRLGTMC